MMSIRKLVSITFGALSLSLSIAAVGAQKFDADLMRLMANPPLAASADPISTSAKLQTAYAETLLRFDGKSLDRVVAAGGQVRSVLGNIATVDIPISALAAISALPEVIYIEAARRQVQRLNFSVPATRAPRHAR